MLVRLREEGVLVFVWRETAQQLSTVEVPNLPDLQGHHSSFQAINYDPILQLWENLFPQKG